MKKKIVVLFAVVLMLLCTVGMLSGCRDVYYCISNTFYDVFGTNLDVVLLIDQNQSDEEALKASEAVCEKLRDIESSISSNTVKYKNSFINRFNALSCGEDVEIDIYTAELIRVCKEIYKETDGYFDPTVYYLVEYWGFGSYGEGVGIERTADKNDDECVEQLLKTVGLDGVELIEQNGAYYLKKTAKAQEYEGKKLELRLDLGGVGKGYAVEKATEYLKSLGYDKGYISLGGSSIYIMQDPTTSDGSIKVKLVNPRSTVTQSNYYGEIYIKDDAVASSGDYERFFEENGVRYCHIIDPKSGYPVSSGAIMATVSGNSTIADAVATVLVTMDGEDREKFMAGKWFNEKITGYSVVTQNDGYKVETSFSLSLTNKHFTLAR